MSAINFPIDNLTTGYIWPDSNGISWIYDEPTNSWSKLFKGWSFTLDSSDNTQYNLYYTDGYVGIGTSPTTKLDILGSPYVLTNSGKSVGGIHLRTEDALSNGQYTNAISFSHENHTASSSISGVVTGGDGDNLGLSFITHPSSTGADDAVEAMRINHLGNVGIGHQSPDNVKLDVRGTTSSWNVPIGAFTNNHNNVTNGANSYPVLRLNRLGSDGVSYSNNVDFGVSRYEDSGTDSRTQLDISLAHTTSSTGNVMSLRSDGNVGIGTTSPNKKLSVLGDFLSYDNSGVDHLHSDFDSRLNIYKYTSYNSPVGELITIGSQNNTAVANGKVFRYSLGLDGGSQGQDLTISSGRKGQTSLDERIRITSGGEIKVGSHEVYHEGNLDINTIGGQWTVSGSDIHYNIGKVGIGTTSPDELLHLEKLTDGVNEGNPGIVLENSDQKWTIFNRGSSSDRFQINDMTDPNATTAPFRIFPGAPTDSIHISSNGNVGIGTSNPSEKLHVDGGSLRVDIGTTPDSAAIFAGGGSNLHIDLDSGYSTFRNTAGDTDASGFRFKSINNDLVTIQNDGNVGIGNTDPYATLEVNTKTIDGSIRIGNWEDVNQTNRYGKGTSIEFISDGAPHLTETNSPHIAASIKALYDKLDDDTDTLKSQNTALSFSTIFGQVGLSSTFSEKMRISSDGNVGIGYHDPAHKLSVHFNEDNSDITDLRTINGIHLYNDDITGSRPKSAMLFRTPGSAIGWVGERISSDSMNLHLTTESNLGLTDDDGNPGPLGIPKVTFTNAGKVGIGTTEPDASLHVDSGSGNLVAKFSSSLDEFAYISFEDNGTSTPPLVGAQGDALRIWTNNSTRLKIDSSGTLTIKGRVTEFGEAGSGANVNGAFLSIEGNTDSAGEGSGRIFFREHNQSTAGADNYGFSIGYKGGGTSITTANGGTWTGLTQIENGEWGFWGHDGSMADVSKGSLIMGGDRTATRVYINPDVGIGTSSPSAKLHLLNSSGSFSNSIPNPTLLLEAPDPLVTFRDTTDPTVSDEVPSDSTVRDFNIKWQRSSTTSGLRFYRGAANNNTNPDLTIDLDGNLITPNHFMWTVSNTNLTWQKADARVDGDEARLHWHGSTILENGNHSSTNFKHAWYDGTNYINVDVESDAVKFTHSDTNQTAELRVEGNLVWHEGNDGHTADSSGLDADLLDGYHATDFKPSITHSFHVYGDSDKFYKVAVNIGTEPKRKFALYRRYNASIGTVIGSGTGDPNWNGGSDTHFGALYIDGYFKDYDWGGSNPVLYYGVEHKYTTVCADIEYGVGSSYNNVFFYLRGGTSVQYFLEVEDSFSPSSLVTVYDENHSSPVSRTAIDSFFNFTSGRKENYDALTGLYFQKNHVWHEGNLDPNTVGGGKWSDGTTSGDIHYSSGNVGIGTSTPETSLHVDGGSILVNAYDNADTGIFFRQKHSPTHSTSYVTANQYNLSIIAYDHNSSGHRDGLSINGYDGISFCTGSNTREQRMIIDDDGNVGIGVDASTYKLNMGGSIDMNNYNIDYVNQLHFQSNVRFYDESNDSYLTYKWGDSGNGGIKFVDGNDNLHGYVFGKSDGSFGLTSSAGEWGVRIIADGETQLYYNGFEKLNTKETGVDITGDLDVSGGIKLNGVTESFGTYSSNISSSTTITADASSNKLWRISSESITGDWTINVTNINLEVGDATNLTFVLESGTGTSYIPDVFQIGSSPQEVKWQGGSAPTGTSGTEPVNIYSFTVFCTSTDTYTVLGNHVSFDK